MKSVKNLRYEDNKVAKTDDSLEELQTELLRLQRQYRFLEEDRRTYREVGHNIFLFHFFFLLMRTKNYIIKCLLPFAYFTP